MVQGSSYSKDKNREAIISEYLDKKLYNSDKGLSLIERVEDAVMQKKGIDVILLFRGKKIKVDEKCATNYLHKDLKTYTLEVSTLTSDRKRQWGWLISPTKETEYYLFMWPRAKKSWRENMPLCISDIDYIDYALVSVQKIVEYLKSHDLSFEQIEMDIDDILKGWYDIDAIPKSEYPRYTYSKNLPEKPINIILKKDTYYNLSEINGRI